MPESYMQRQQSHSPLPVAAVDGVSASMLAIAIGYEVSRASTRGAWHLRCFIAGAESVRFTTP